MQGSFTDSAGRLSGLAGALLSWNCDQFWCATPAELSQIFAALGGGISGGPGGVIEAGPLDRPTFEKLKKAFPDG